MHCWLACSSFAFGDEEEHDTHKHQALILPGIVKKDEKMHRAKETPDLHHSRAFLSYMVWSVPGELWWNYLKLPCVSTAEERLLSVKKKLMDKITECERKESDLVEGIKNEVELLE